MTNPEFRHQIPVTLNLHADLKKYCMDHGLVMYRVVQNLILRYLEDKKNETDSSNS